MTINIDLTPTVLAATVTGPAPVTVNVADPQPITVDITTPALAVAVQPSAVAISAVIGVPGTSGATTVKVLTVHCMTAYALSGQRCVTFNDDGLLIYADAGDLDHVYRPTGLTEGAWDADVVATFISEGSSVCPDWNWTPGLPIFLGTNGVLTQTQDDPDWVFIRQVAEVINPTAIRFVPRMPILKG